MQNGKTFSTLTLISLALLLSPLINQASASVGQPQMYERVRGKAHYRHAMRCGLNFTIRTDVFTVRFAGSLSKTTATVGENVIISANVSDEEGNPIEGATVKAETNGVTVLL